MNAKYLAIIVCLLGCVSTPGVADNAPPPGGGTPSTPVPADGIIDDAMAGWVFTQDKEIDDPQLHGGTAHALPSGATGTYTFHGTSVEVYTMAGPTVTVDGRAHKLGNLQVSIDGKLDGTSSQSQPSPTYDFESFNATNLSNGNHVLQLTADAGWAVIDYIKVQAGNAPDTSDQAAGTGGATVKTAVVNYANGFFDISDLQLNGSAMESNNAIVLTDGNGNEVGTVFTTGQVSTKKFEARFRFQLVRCQADGFVFCLQSGSPTAKGANGEGIGYAGIDHSIAVKFDSWDNAGEGQDSTGLFDNGAVPTVPAIDLAPYGIKLRDGNPIDVDITYDGSFMHVTETDVYTQGSAEQSYQVDVSKYTGAKAYAGFTASTGSSTETAVLLGWTMK